MITEHTILLYRRHGCWYTVDEFEAARQRYQDDLHHANPYTYRMLRNMQARGEMLPGEVARYVNERIGK